MSWFPIHPVVTIRTFLAWAVWERGGRERSWKLAEEAAEYALRQTDQLSIAHALHFVCWIAAIDRNPERAVQAAEDAHSRSEGGFPLYDAITGVLWGWARSALGQADEGLAQLTASLEAMEATGAWMVHSYYLALLAEAQRQAGQPEEALATVERAFRFAEERDEGFYERASRWPGRRGTGDSRSGRPKASGPLQSPPLEERVEEHAVIWAPGTQRLLKTS